MRPMRSRSVRRHPRLRRRFVSRDLLSLGRRVYPPSGRETPVMRSVRMGRTGLKVSELCLGTMTFGLQTDREESLRIMDVAAEAGIDFIDVADVYPVGGTLETVGRTEEIGGEWL